MSVNIIGFAYSIAQAFDLIHQFVKGKSFVLSRLRLYIDFAIDQASHLTPSPVCFKFDFCDYSDYDPISLICLFAGILICDLVD